MCAPPTVFLLNFTRNPFLVPYKGSCCSWFWISPISFLPGIPRPLKPRYGNLSSHSTWKSSCRSKTSVIFISLLFLRAHSAGRVSSTSIAESKIGTVCLSIAWSYERILTKALTCLAFYKVTIFLFSGTGCSLEAQCTSILVCVCMLHRVLWSCLVELQSKCS